VHGTDRRQVLRDAIRQLERAEIYLDAVAAMEIDDREANRELFRVRSEVDTLRRHLVDVRSVT
jgi:hypothetical protein